ncbi:TPA: hypothetical protein ACGJTR_003504 [Pseudomonas aeruginosa]|uniref:hypothetical protein n=1 Tax=Pseudomonas aeruginosa TaxID=287 RepID=UPI000A5E0E71|nr:hypothetical protein [Pseudomonas aeruginosa]MEA8571479.1 hypothetical protein [Pseudomonas aeruginosa]
MNKANECTCPSGDGSLVHPCPAHPAVEQAGANVGHGHVFPRADGVKMRCGGPGLCSECTADASRARAALAQPSPAPELAERGTQHRFSTTEQTCRHDFAGVWWNDNGETKTGRECRHCGFFVADVTKAQAEQAEAERPEVVATMYTHHDDVDFREFVVVGNCDKGCEGFYGPEKLMTVAQHERIVGELRADRDSWAEQAEQRLADWDEMRKERDAALAKVERLRESKGDPSGSFDRCMKMMYERDENAKRLDAALARVAELEKGTVYVEARQCDECQHVGINDSADGLAACHDCDWTGPEPDEDKCPDCQRENCMAAACPQCGARYVLVASEEIAAPVAQAQHSVPEGVTIERDVAGTIHIKVGDFDFIQLQYQRPYTDNASTWKLAERIASLLAAAPGTEVPQAWLDVQAERRRQITAEGWTPDHDDLYCAAELPRAAAAYILSGANDEAPAIWPFSAKWWKPRDARANYMRAGALILAEIERLDRAAERGKEVGHE